MIFQDCCSRKDRLIYWIELVEDYLEIDNYELPIASMYRIDEEGEEFGFIFFGIRINGEEYLESYKGPTQINILFTREKVIEFLYELNVELVKTYKNENTTRN